MKVENKLSDIKVRKRQTEIDGNRDRQSEEESESGRSEEGRDGGGSKLFKTFTCNFIYENI